MSSYITTVTTKGQVVIPKALRDKLNIKPSSKIIFDIKDDQIIMEPLKKYNSGRGIIKTKKKATEKEIRDAIKRGHIENFLKDN